MKCRMNWAVALDAVGLINCTTDQRLHNGRGLMHRALSMVIDCSNFINFPHSRVPISFQFTWYGRLRYSGIIHTRKLLGFKTKLPVILTECSSRLGSSLYSLHVNVIMLVGVWIDVLIQAGLWIRCTHNESTVTSHLVCLGMQWVSINGVRQPAFKDIGGDFFNLSELLHSLMVRYIDKNAHIWFVCSTPKLTMKYNIDKGTTDQGVDCFDQ